MNEFIEQFLIESREHVEQASADLLALEKTPEDKARLDSAFRALHTLKGGAGIVDFTAMARAVHAAEDALSSVRSNALPITSKLVGDCLACLDRVSQWLDVIERTGDLPSHAQAEATAIAARFAGHEATDAAQRSQRAAPEDWVQSLLTKHASLGAGARTAVRCRPPSDCFYQGIDPLALISAMPGLLAVDVSPVSPWPPLDALDPFVSNLVLTALTRSPPDEVIASLQTAADYCDVQPLAEEDEASGLLSPQAREVLEAQIALLGETAPQGAAGRTASAGLVAANVLRSAGRAAQADDLTRSTQAALAANDSGLVKEAIEAALKGTPSARAASASPVSPEAERQARTLRIDAARVDALVSLTGELTVAANAIGHAAKLLEQGGPEIGPLLKDRYSTLQRLVGELQHGVLGMRVLPLGHVFQRFPRLVREIAGELGKPASLVIEGGHTEADKAIVENLFEPILHVLRNAIDHGIESPETRAARNKPATAIIGLRARREGEHVVVEVSDDGAGIDVARIRELARQRGLVAEEVLSAMSDEEVINIIFEAGFSTAGEVTGLSGRGVGMDAVRSAVARLAGHVSVESHPGHGTTVRLTLPFSVMMTRVMVVGVGAQTFGIPLDAVVETLRIEADRIAPLGTEQVVVVRNRTIPLVNLAAALGVARDERHEAEVTIVIAKVDGHYGALRVDRIGERMDVMLKPLEGLLTGMPGLAGSTLLGDGSVLLILDIATLLQ